MAKRKYSSLQKAYWGYTGAIYIDGKRYKTGTVGKMEKEADNLIKNGLTVEVGIEEFPSLKVLHIIHRRK